MRHLHATQSIEPLRGGGLGIAAKDIHAALLDEQIPSLFFSTHEHPEQVSIPKSFIYPPRGGKKFFYAPAMKQELPRHSDEFDLAHLHGFYVYPNWVVGSFCRKNHKPLVCHPHGFFEPWILQRSRLMKKVVHGLFETANFKATRLWRALTNKEADQIRAQGIDAAIVVAPNGIHLDEWQHPSTEPLPEKTRKHALFLGRIHPKKGLPLLVDAWKALEQEAGDWELIIAGPDELEHQAQLETQIRKHQLEDSIRFVGTVTGESKKAWYESADLFILPSYSEGFSVAILEAMVNRIPVLATTPCNFPELATDGGGWNCEPEAESLKSTLAQALSTTEAERKDRGDRARKLIEDRYTWASIARNLDQACEEHCR